MKVAFWNSFLIGATKGERLGPTYFQVSIFQASWDVVPAIGRAGHDGLRDLLSVMCSYFHFILLTHMQSSIVIFICYLKILVHLVFADASEDFGSTVGNDNNIGFLFCTKNVW